MPFNIRVKVEFMKVTAILSVGWVLGFVGRLGRRPESERFSPGKDGEAGDDGFIVDTAGCTQAEKEPLEARPSFPTEPRLYHIHALSYHDNKQPESAELNLDLSRST